MVNITRYDVINFLFVFGAVGVAAYAWFVYGFLTQSVIPLGGVVSPGMRNAFNTEKGAIYTHALCSAVCLLIGPFQVIPSFRRKHLLAHRRAGYIYFIFSVAGSVSALVCAQKAHGGMAGRSGFTTLGVLWILSNVVGFVSMVFFKNRSLHEHAMQISCALVYAAVTLRMCLPFAMINNENFDYAYGIIAWVCWTFNLAVLEIVRYFVYYYKWETNNNLINNNDNGVDNDGTEETTEDQSGKEKDNKESTPLLVQASQE